MNAFFSHFQHLKCQNTSLIKPLKSSNRSTISNCVVSIIWNSPFYQLSQERQKVTIANIKFVQNIQPIVCSSYHDIVFKNGVDDVDSLDVGVDDDGAARHVQKFRVENLDEADTENLDGRFRQLTEKRVRDGKLVSGRHLQPEVDVCRVDDQRLQRGQRQQRRRHSSKFVVCSIGQRKGGSATKVRVRIPSIYCDLLDSCK